jgi:hypothetical protein
MGILRIRGPKVDRDDPGFVYLMAAEHGGVKVGMSTDPDRRCIEVNRKKTINAKVVFKRFFADYQLAEQRAHSALRNWRLSNEWYSCPASVAIAAIEGLPA